MNLKYSNITMTAGFIIMFVLSAIPQFPLQPDYVYVSNIHFPEIYIDGAVQTMPIIELNSNEKLRISFDDLNQNTERYSYQVIHCNYDWTISDLVFQQYMNGFENYEIFDYKFSTNTTQSYTHYWFYFPNEFMRPTIPGNYIMRVFKTTNPDETIFTRRFMVVEQKVGVDAKVRYASNVEYRNTHQEVYFTLNTGGLTIQDAYNDLKVVIMQNNRWDNIKYDFPPQFISPSKYVYNYTSGETTFPAGNQYRFLDLKTLMLIIEPINKVLIDQGKYHILLRPDDIRTFRNFQMQPDINGRFVIYNQDTYDTSIDPDYAYVYFSLPADFPFEEGDVYLFGGFTFGQFSEQYKMQYNEKFRMYELVTQLKQGYYNYIYVVKNKKNGESITYLTEGDFAETENDYTIFVYIRQPGDLAHKLYGVTHINSLKDR